MSYPDIAVLARRSIDRTHRSNRLRASGFGDQLAWNLAAKHDVRTARIAETPTEMTGWQVTYL